MCLVNLKTIRESRAMTQQQMGKFLRVSPSIYLSYELGISSPRVPKLIEMAQKLEVSVDYLLGLDKKPQTDIPKQILEIQEQAQASLSTFEIHSLLLAAYSAVKTSKTQTDTLILKANINKLEKEYQACLKDYLDFDTRSAKLFVDCLKSYTYYKAN